MEPVLWIIANVLLTLPGGFEVTAQRRDTLDAPGPPGSMAVEEYRAWTGPQGQTVHLFWWAPRPPREGGPLRTARSWPVRVAGREAHILETETFLGREQKVLVTHLRFEQPEARVMIYAQGMTLGAFRRLLETVRLSDKTPP